MPKTLYGCEVTPVNETALRVLRSSFLRCMTYTTVRRSADLVFAMASEGSDLDPDINIFVRRVAAARRYITKNAEHQETIKGIARIYAARKEPGAYQSDEVLDKKELGGDLATKERAKLRKECKPEGPYGLLLESTHLQAAALDEKMKIKTQDAFTIDIAEAPIQQLAPLTRQLAMRNRTATACGAG